MGTVEADRSDGRTPNQLRPLACSRNLLHRAHGSARWSQGDTIVLAAVYGPKAGTRKGENPEKASIEVIWKPKTGQIGKQEKEYEMILKRTVQSICLLNIHPNTTTSVIVQVVGDDGALLPCAINASCVALVDAGIPLKHLAVAICCGLTESGSIILDPTLVEEQTIQAFAYLAFPNSPLSVIPKSSYSDEAEPIKHGMLTSKSSCSDGAEPIENGIITSVTHGAMSGYSACTINGCLLQSLFESCVKPFCFSGRLFQLLGTRACCLCKDLGISSEKLSITNHGGFFKSYIVFSLGMGWVIAVRNGS